MKQKNAVTPTPARISGMKQGEKKPGKGVPVDKGRLVDFFGNAGHEPFQDPYRQRYVEQAMRQGHGDVGVDQVHGGIELEIGQQENRRRGHAVGQQPEKHLPVAQELEARKGIGRGQGKGQGHDRVQADIDHGIDIARVPGRVGEDLDVVGKGEVGRIQGKGTQDIGIAAQGHVEHPVDGYKQQHEIENQGEGSLCGFS
jgi:hypothetical protein